MIDLNNYTHEELQYFKVNVEKAPHLIWKKTPFLRTLHAQVLKEVGKEYSLELWVILTNSAKCVRFETKGFYLSLNNNHYLEANKKYKHTLSPIRMRKLLPLLESLGYITVYNGYYNSEDDYCRTIIILRNVMECIDYEQAKRFAITRDGEQPLVKVKDMQLSTPSKYVMKKGVLTKQRSLNVYKNTRTIRNIKPHANRVKLWNDILEDNVIAINGVVDNCIIAQQLFEDSLDLCGRYYFGSFQVQDNKLRKGITINCNKTVEIDYANCQPRMLATMAGVTLSEEFDAYAIEGLDRTFAKGLLFPILFTNSRGDAKTSITKKLKEEGITHINSEEVVELFLNHNPYLREYAFNKKLYQQLQNNDSRMLAYVADHFLNKGVCILGYHDSVVIEEEYEAELAQVMLEAWEEIMGSVMNCKLKVEKETQCLDEGLLTLDTITPLEAYNSLEVQNSYDNDEDECDYQLMLQDYNDMEALV